MGSSQNLGSPKMVASFCCLLHASILDIEVARDLNLACGPGPLLTYKHDLFMSSKLATQVNGHHVFIRLESRLITWLGNASLNTCDQ